jgi:hypothetical protein
MSSTDFSEAVRQLPSGRGFTREQLLTSTFRLLQIGKVEIYYAPVDVLNADARVAIVGITPGWTQMEIAYREFRIALDKGLTVDEACDKGLTVDEAC